jgi:hypothetical protein
VTSSRWRFESSYLTTSGYGTTSAGRCSTAERSRGRSVSRPSAPQTLQSTLSSTPEQAAAEWPAIDPPWETPVSYRRIIADLECLGSLKRGRLDKPAGPESAADAGSTQAVDEAELATARARQRGPAWLADCRAACRRSGQVAAGSPQASLKRRTRQIRRPATGSTAPHRSIPCNTTDIRSPRVRSPTSPRGLRRLRRTLILVGGCNAAACG